MAPHLPRPAACRGRSRVDEHVQHALYALTLVYLALIYFRPTEILRGWQGVPVVLIASIVSAPLLAFQLCRNPGKLVELPQDRFLLGYCLSVPLSNLAWGSIGDAMTGFASFAQVAYQYFLIRIAIHEPKQFRGVIRLLLAAAVFLAVSGILQYETGYGFGGVEPVMSRGRARVQGVGIFNDPNDLALTLLTAVPFLLATILWRGGGSIVRVPAFLGTTLVLLALYFTNSRGAMLALRAALTVFAWRRFGRAAGLSVAIVSLAVLLIPGSSRLTGFAGMPSRTPNIDARDRSAQDRIQAWSRGLQMLESEPLTGVGWRRFTQFHARVAHNSFVHSLAELGLLGGACFIGMVYWYFQGLRRLARQAPPGADPVRDWHDALVSSGAGFFVGINFLSRQYNPVLYTVLALGAAAVSIGQRHAGVAIRGRWSDLAAVLALTGAYIVMVLIAGRTLMI